jgi:thymidylate synthase (FAD)
MYTRLTKQFYRKLAAKRKLLMNKEIKVLDHGFVRLLNVSSAIPREYEYEEFNTDGTEEGIDIVQEFSARDIDPAKCARISFNNFEAEREESIDLKLVKYLMTNRHNTPIEMTEVWLEMKLPIFIARQFVRHRTACINEVSARYTQLPAEWYIPEVVGGKPTGGAKQGQEDTLTKEQQQLFRVRLHQHCQSGYWEYLAALEDGVAPEQARLFLTLNHYTHWIWKQDLHNLLHFLSLRDHSHAQLEARLYAKAIKELLRGVLPKTIEYFEELNHE